MTSRDRAASHAPLQPRDYLILLALAGGRCHGYGLITEIARMTDDAVRMDPANLHRALQRLVRDGWVRDLGQLETEAGSRRRYYSVTAQGIELARVEAQRLDRLSAVARSRLSLGEREGA